MYIYIPECAAQIPAPRLAGVDSNRRQIAHADLYVHICMYTRIYIYTGVYTNIYTARANMHMYLYVNIYM